ncbi:MAG: chromosome segregation protein SMC, partial [Actinomycetaceae bacterium]|nr:chromosome segregation protein SMC [Actinomycetaceae bacterium]
MHLKTLTLRGFKSFATATTLRFEPGINVVVGPNGSGKSNVVDALAWVMGEQGVKHLRGGQMADVIFAGTNTRQPLGRAEVSLTIDNSDGALPIDYSEVTISRTIFRSGGSEYAINGSPCRLLDIQELLSDTGMGREMHVLIGQGRLDEVLTATPEDRRGFIEEAAGVLKHRRRKEKALRKLDNMADSLTRLEDLSGELRRQLGPLARQAEAARKAQHIQAEVRDARARLLADDLALQQARMEAGALDEAQMKAKVEENERQCEAARAALAELEEAAAPASPELSRLTEQWERVASLEERFRSLGQLASERHRSLSAVHAFVPRETPEEIRERAVRAREEEEALRGDVQQGNDELHEAIEKREAEEKLGRALERELSDIQRAIADHREDTARLNGQIATASSRIEALEAEKERVERARVAAKERADESSAQCARLEEEIVAASQSEDSLATSHEEAAGALAAARTQLEELHAREAQLREAYASWTAKADTLALSLEAEDATAWAMQSHSSALSLLRDWISVKSGWESAAECALAGAASGVLAPDLPTAIDILREVRDGEAGRLDITIAAADAGSDSETHEEKARNALKKLGTKKSETDAVAVYALDVVTVKGTAKKALERALSGCVLAADLVTARELVEAGSPAVATLAGDLVTPTRASGGEKSQLSILARKRAWEEAQEQAEKVRQELGKLDGERAQAHNNLDSATEIYERTSADLNARDSHLAAVTAQLGVLRQSTSAALKEVERSAQRLDAIAQELVECEDECESLQRRLDTLETDPKTLEKDIEDKQSRLRAIQERVEEARSAETSARLALRTLEERLRSRLGQAESLERDAEALEARMDREARAAQRRAKACELAERVGVQASRALVATGALRARIGSERATVEAERSVRDKELVQSRHRLDELLAARRELDDTAHRRELALAEQRLRLEQIEARALEELGIDGNSLIDEYGPLAQIPMPTDNDPERTVPYVREEQEERLAKAEKKLARLGRINPLALEEHAALEERAKYLAGQISDLKESRAHLLGIVAEIDEKVEAVLRSALTDVSERFTQVFSVLFPGGDGKLVVSDPDSPLTTGVDIEARPPGKKIKRLSLLSGGE